MFDQGTIAACITGSPPAAIAVVRLSGPDAWKIAGRLFAPWPGQPAHGQMVFGRFVHGDEGYAVAFAPGRSYTGEASVELHVHGSRASVRALLGLAAEAGAREAKPGEFTLRAFLHGRIDLAQAEAVRDTVEALTERQARLAGLARSGILAEAVRGAAAHARDVLAAVEAATDFPDEVGDLDRGWAANKLDGAAAALRSLVRGAEGARIVRQGAHVAILGRPNAGKSSLLNRLLGEERAIVTPAPGTTRDVVDAWLDVCGFAVRLLDTAGLRKAADDAEAQGVLRAREAARRADAVLYVFDGAAGWSEEDSAEASALERPAVLLANKADLGLAPSPPEGALPVSALTGEGVGAAVHALGDALEAMAEGAGPANERHARLLAAAEADLAAAADGLRQGDPTDLAAVHLAGALRLMGEATGEEAGPDTLDQVFRDFCVGK